MKNRSIIEEQIKYYRKRASEYDQWFLRLGRYDRGDEHKRRWFAELDIIRKELRASEPFDQCLELACGTGLWTSLLANGAKSLTAIDAVAETIELSRSKLNNKSIQYETADIFKWSPKKKYDFIFFGFWLSHVPADKFDSFWNTVQTALKPNGKVFFVDSLETQQSTARDHAVLNKSGIVERKLNDGQSFNVVKIFYKPEQLNKRLQTLGWTGNIEKTGQFFYYGKMKLK